MHYNAQTKSRGSYQDLYFQAQANPEEFWGAAADQLVWNKRWDSVVCDQDAPLYRWFSGGRINMCYNAVDRHVDDGFGEQTAIIYDSAMTGQQRKISFAQLQDEVARVAGAIHSLGVRKGDRVIIYMPMIPEALFGVLACARIGAIHSVVFGGFAAAELATRIKDAMPKVILSASCGLEVNRVVDYKALLDEALRLSITDNPAKRDEAPEIITLIKQRPEQPCTLIEGRDRDWEDLVPHAQPQPCADTASTDPLYILYTSGTTGKPKGIVRDQGGQAVVLHWSMKHIYDMNPGEVYWAASDIGWVVGHSYIIYGPLLNRNTTLLYEGKPVGTPDPGAFWRVIQEHRVKVLFTAPTAIRAIKREDHSGEYRKCYDLSSLESLFLAGEHCDPDTIHWSSEQLGVPVVDHWWQTETSWAIAGNPLGVEPLEIRVGSCTKAMPGYQVEILDHNGAPKPAGELGNIAIRLPLPPGTLIDIWNNRQHCIDSYFSRFEGYYLTGDSGLIDADGYIFVMGRIDDVINTAGHRLSTGQIEEILCEHPAVAEAVTFGVKDELKGELPLALIVKNKDEESLDDASLYTELIALVRKELGPVAAFRLVASIDRLPKTRSGKILRATMRCIANGEPWKMPATIEAPETLDRVGEVLQGLGYPKQGK